MPWLLLRWHAMPGPNREIIRYAGAASSNCPVEARCGGGAKPGLLVVWLVLAQHLATARWHEKRRMKRLLRGGRLSARWFAVNY